MEVISLTKDRNKSPSLESFSLSILPAKSLEQINTEKYMRAFQLWKSVWEPTLKKLDGLSQLFSDGFTRQDFLCLIEYNDTAVGLCCFRSVHLRSEIELEDSWFQPWPKNLLKGLALEYPKALIPSWLTVHPDYRRSNGYFGPNISQILAELIALSCITTSSDIAFGTPRKDLSVTKLVSSAGATTLVENVIHHNVEIDLVAFFPEKIKNRKFNNETIHLWNRRLDLRQPLIRKEKNYELSDFV